MKHIQHKKSFAQINSVASQFISDDSIMFDIETTGFVKNSCIIYLIGTLRKEGNSILIDQFLAESKSDEELLLQEFSALMKTRNTYITFNGVRFDVPFVQERCKHYGLENCFYHKKSFDIYLEIRPYKNILKLPNYKQKTIEDFLDIHREDPFTGGDLIEVFKEYCHTHHPHLEKALLIHNYEDVLGMLDLFPILTYKKFLEGAFTVTDIDTHSYTSYDGIEQKEVIITMNNQVTLPREVSFSNDEIYIHLGKETSRIRIPLLEGTLYHFFPNYKDYYYLPKEDMAIHKSVAEFVDKEYRQKAKPSNCYTPMTGQFLPQYEPIITPCFHKCHKDSISYFSYTVETFDSTDILSKYVEHLLNSTT